MDDYHAIQMTGTSCQGKNCAAASTAMDVHMGTRGHTILTADEVRRRSGVSCTPGVDTPSGGLAVPDIERVCRAYGVNIDFYGTSSSLRRWNDTEIYARSSTYYSGHLLGMYANVDDPWRAKRSTFRGGHSLVIHDVRDDLPDSHYGKVQRTACWHDPLRPRSIRVPWSVVEAYTQTTSPLTGYAGWVKVPAIPGGTYAKPMTDRTRVRYASAAVHRDRTTGRASTTRIIQPEGRLVEIAMYATGQEYRGSTEWGALSLLGNEWVHLKRLEHVRGTT